MMAMERHKKSVIGPLRAVPCPWCNHKNDMREINEQFPLEGGCILDCDKCSNKSEVVVVDREPRVILKQKHR
jgi:C4-type Zn-finger protein